MKIAYWHACVRILSFDAAIRARIFEDVFWNSMEYSISTPTEQKYFIDKISTSIALNVCVVFSFDLGFDKHANNFRYHKLKL